MFARIVVGILIGLVAGFVEARVLPLSQSTQSMTQGLLVLIGLAFVVSSFMFGAIFGVMAIVEIVAGYHVSSALFNSQNAKS